jgi:hypothetical protein
MRLFEYRQGRRDRYIVIFFLNLLYITLITTFTSVVLGSQYCTSEEAKNTTPFVLNLIDIERGVKIASIEQFISTKNNHYKT